MHRSESFLEDETQEIETHIQSVESPFFISVYILREKYAQIPD